jgi:uncharacterized membrane protein
MEHVLIQDDTIVTGLLLASVGLVFYTSQLSNKFWKQFYTIFPPLLMCYLIPALFNSFNVISSEVSGTYGFAKDYTLPAALVLMTLSIDLKGILNLGPKSLIMFLTGTLGVIIGGPLAIALFQFISPDTVGGEGADAVWRGMSTLAGSWIGGGANQAAMLEIYGFNQEKYGAMVLVDIVVANIWMAFLLFGVGKTEAIDRWLKADSSAIDELKKKVEAYQQKIARTPSLADYMMILGLAFAAVSLSHYGGKNMTAWMDQMPSMAESVLNSKFFWVVVFSTTIGLLLSFSPARKLEGAGASKIGSVFIYFLVATIGMKMDIFEIVKYPGLFFVGLSWMAIHVGLLFLVARIIRAPFFFLAVGSKANIGGAASAPVVAAAFHPSLAPVGVLLAVLGYALGTYGAIVCTEIMRWVSSF